MKPFHRESLQERAESRLRHFSFSSQKKKSFWSRFQFFLAWKKRLQYFSPPPPPPKKPRWHIFFWGVLFLLGGSVAGLGIFLAVVLKDLPSVENLQNFHFSEATLILAADGKTPLYSVYGEENRKVVPLSEMPKTLISALLAAEDDAFYRHPGFDFGGILMAACSEITGICPTRGGSTLTQQMVKNIFLTPERTLVRKIREVVLAYRIEQNFTKDQILEIYLNAISFGSNFYGAETASKAFFGKSVREISLVESAILAAIPQAPGYFSPFGENAFSRVLMSTEEIEKNNWTTFEDINNLPGISWKPGLLGKEIPLASGSVAYFPGRTDWVLQRMKSLEFISEQEYEDAQQEMQTIRFSRYREKITAPHFVFFVKSQLEEKFGAEAVEHGGLRVITTLDLRLQEIAEVAVENSRERNIKNYNAHNAALVAVEPDTGYVKALVGSADYWDEEIDGKVNMVLAKRQPGSSFKPLVYAAAFANGILSPASVVMDTETNFGNGWIPKNYDGTFSGPVSLRYALGHSLNIPAVKTALLVGAEKVYALAEKMGMSFDFPAEHYGSAIALGGAEVRPMDMVTAFSTLVRGGKKVDPLVIARVEDRFGNILWENTPAEDPEVILDPGAAFLVTHILADSSARAAWGSVLSVGRPAMAKTGTSNEEKTSIPRDTWTVGGTPNLMIAVWAGNNEPAKNRLGKNADGSSTAAPIWREFLQKAEQEWAPREFEMPKGISRVLVSRLSGKLPAPETPASLLGEDLFLSAFVPQEHDTSLKFLEIDAVSGKLPTENTPEKAKKKVAVLDLHDIDPTRENWETPAQNWLSENAELFLERFGIQGEILSRMPTEYDDVHTPLAESQKPFFSFVRPVSGSLVSPPRITVTLEIQAKNDLQEVNFLWDEKPVFSEVSAGNFTVKIPKNATGAHTLSAIVTDALWYESSQSISVVAGEDNEGPLVSLSLPKTVFGGQEILLQAEADDAMGAIAKLEFFSGQDRIGIDLFAPYEIRWTPEDAIQNLQIRAVATDTQGNVAEDEAILRVAKGSLSSSFAIINPSSGDVLSCEEVLVNIGLRPEMIADFESLIVYGKPASKDSFSSLSSSKEKNRWGYVVSAWNPEECGPWELFAENADGEKTPIVSVILQEQ